jgi:hypothetical protein
MIKCVTLRDSAGRIKTFSKNQDFSAYEQHKWSLGMGADGKMITYLPIGQDSLMTLSFGRHDSFLAIYIFAGDYFTLEEEGAPAVNPLTPLAS